MAVSIYMEFSLILQDYDFPLVNYPDYPSGFCDLDNENLIPRSKFLTFRDSDTVLVDQVFEMI